MFSRSASRIAKPGSLLLLGRTGRSRERPAAQRRGSAPHGGAGPRSAAAPSSSRSAAYSPDCVQEPVARRSLRDPRRQRARMQRAAGRAPGRVSRRRPGRSRRLPRERSPRRTRRDVSSSVTLVIREKVVAPVDGRSEGLVSWVGKSVPGAEKAEAIVETGRDLVEGESLRARGGELDRKRKTVELAADPRHGHGSLIRPPQVLCARRVRARGTTGPMRTARSRRSARRRSASAVARPCSRPRPRHRARFGSLPTLERGCTRGARRVRARHTPCARCSQLSSTSSSSSFRRWSMSPSRAETSGRSATPSTCATAVGTRELVTCAVMSTSQTPPVQAPI